MLAEVTLIGVGVNIILTSKLLYDIQRKQDKVLSKEYKDKEDSYSPKKDKDYIAAIDEQVEAKKKQAVEDRAAHQQANKGVRPLSQGQQKKAMKSSKQSYMKEHFKPEQETED